MTNTPNQLDQISGIGPQTIKKLEKINIINPSNLLFHFPSRYLDFSHITKIKDAQTDSSITVTGKVLDFKNIYTRHGKNIQKAIIQDSTGQMELLWFNQPYLSSSINIGSIISFAGTVTLYQNKKTIISPEHGQYNTGKIIAVYPETQGLGSKWFRKTIQNNIKFLVSQIEENLPKSILKEYNLHYLESALFQIHLPTNDKLLNLARLRLALDEILSLQSQSYLTKKEWLSKQPQNVLNETPKIKKQIKSLLDSLPFKLTSSQKEVWQEIKSDLLSSQKIMNRLLQGDVGSGKTIIALLAAYLTHLNNFSSLIIAPTEILARQHFQNFEKFLKPFKVPIFLLTANNKVDLKKIPHNSIIIGTHAVIFRKVELGDQVGLLVIDEQHKFGVKQRAFLNSSIKQPHTLTMTATPIPRTIYLTFLGNLELSTINALPENRKKIKTFLVPNHKKMDCYRWVENQIKTTKCQAFIVCPFIEESETLTSIKSAKKEFEFLSQSIFPNLKLALIHGKMKSEEREKVIADFQANKINILITTPIIEVGVDIPNASIIIIQSADRFGLASLHQLRGRVGRGQEQSFCYLFTESNNQKALNRLQFIQGNHNGLKIAEYDLKTRGPGEAFSIIQHGFPSLKLANLSDLKLIKLSEKILSSIIAQNPNFDLNKLIKENTNAYPLNPSVIS
ncbi:MAG: ATP-dependent DNA helicase RecG [Candidatus Shapirobacteria bacterium]|nr:ATP-dependent DNA helicase RecG [Candidatus Shapirobacteria bacterium]